MSYHFDRQIYFDAVRASLFSGRLTQQQVDGQNFILDVWEAQHTAWDLRWLGYPLATTLHETASTMWPIEEYGKGKGQPYGKPDPVTGKTYYGRGFVQLTWEDNYAKMNPVLRAAFPDDDIDLVMKPEQALVPAYAAEIMFYGMSQGSFRASSDGKRQTLARYFSAKVDDAYTAREIINGDKTKVPSWSNGVSIGNLIKGYHGKFLSALQSAQVDIEPPTPPEPEPTPEPQLVTVNITTPRSCQVEVILNGEVLVAAPI
jgi:putative chitinase